ncbi:hypothetical protein BOTCAL_0083g00010 [Botryotinia calthae]|uniref:Uncharacterized protein n=1 Tax=Botryotinia calthae TaxID=38488 RepID=A0A4Y8D7M1_9HELO|nr:hypothetical protein BOTCAL_0083g00010 [Botryotinia calthae]
MSSINNTAPQAILMDQLQTTLTQLQRCHEDEITKLIKKKRLIILLSMPDYKSLIHQEFQVQPKKFSLSLNEYPRH